MSKLLLFLFLILLNGCLFSSGTLTDLGGFKLYSETRGSGSPTVIFESGAGYSSNVWDNVDHEVARYFRVFLYDRAGLGKSQLSPKPRTVKEIVSELHQLLAKRGIDPPYILVGHSMGGLYVRYFQSRYPSEVVGLVLVDPWDENLFKASGLSVEKAMSMGIKRGVKQIKDKGVAVEVAAAETTFRQMRQAKLNDLGNLPLVVISHGIPFPIGSDPRYWSRINKVMWQLQKEQAKRSVRGRLLTAKLSKHFIQGTQPELVVEAIKQVYRETLKGGKKR